jgi:cysteine desulfurase
MNEPIYLDGFATLPLAPEAQAAILAAWSRPGNAGSPNAAGEHAARIVADGRSAVAALIGAAPDEVIFTSGATEANNLAIFGAARALARLHPGRRRLLLSAIEHKAVLEPAHHLEAEGFSVTIVPVDHTGTIDLDALRTLASNDVLLASIMLVNNELGTVQPVAEAAAIIHDAGGFIHCDASQAVGKIPVDVLSLDVDYLSLSAHKCYGPMGIGALYISASAVKPDAQLFGGNQQNGYRSGTEPVPLIAGFGEAARLASATLNTDALHCDHLLSTLLDHLRERQLRFKIVSGNAARVPGGAAIAIAGIDSDMLSTLLTSQVSISTGSACTSGQIKISHVLEAIGLTELEARSVIRLFCNRYTSEDEILAAADHITAAVARSTLVTGDIHQ